MAVRSRSISSSANSTCNGLRSKAASSSEAFPSSHLQIQYPNSQSFAQKRQDIAPHFRWLRMTHVVAQQFPVGRLAQPLIHVAELALDAIQSGRRSEVVAIAGCRQVRPR